MRLFRHIGLLTVFSAVSAGLAAVLSGTACGAGGVRPTFDLFPEAVIDTVPGEPGEIVLHLSELLGDEGLELRWARVLEGYVETKWFNPTTAEVGGGRSLDTEGVIRIRFWTDLVLEDQSVVVVEAVKRRVFDPSLPVRQTEAPLGSDHPIYDLIRRVLDDLSSVDHSHTP